MSKDSKFQIAYFRGGPAPAEQPSSFLKVLQISFNLTHKPPNVSGGYDPCHGDTLTWKCNIPGAPTP